MSSIPQGARRLEESRLTRFAMRCASWAEERFPDFWVFAVTGIFIVLAAALRPSWKISQAAISWRYPD